MNLGYFKSCQGIDKNKTTPPLCMTYRNKICSGSVLICYLTANTIPSLTQTMYLQKNRKWNGKNIYFQENHTDD